MYLVTLLWRHLEMKGASSTNDKLAIHFECLNCDEFV